MTANGSKLDVQGSGPFWSSRRREGSNSDSLSKGHNSDGRAIVQPDLHFKLCGSQAKTAFALRMNCETLIESAGEGSTKAERMADGVKRVGFLTLTIGDTGSDGKFRGIVKAEEASRRVNNLRKLLAEIFERWIIVSERHKSGAIHFHLLGTMAGRVDIRTGFDHAAMRRNGYTGACGELRAVWEILNERLPGFGFGRAQLTPIEKTGEAIASYVSKYVEKNLFNRLDADKGKKLVRYGGWKGSHLRTNSFSWATPGASEWRLAAQTCAASMGIKSREEMAGKLGPRWAFRVSKVMDEFATSRAMGTALDLQFLRHAMHHQFEKWERWNHYCDALTAETLPSWWRDVAEFERMPRV